ncbi:lmo0937 family membrane protein [Mucilaginibacter pedocola]|uniref:lmo0937 family membrane protein n=1 Tax=Mucilaginibacter pedocola TaxID=1792845 RepID=UPI00117D5DF4|nr:lmo0937 family membrane protein [Mucilaginibacter pedocola]
MNSLLYTIAVILVIGWAVGFFFTTVGGLINILLVLAVIAVILGIIRRPTAI